MELIVISDTKLKLILTAADMKTYALDFDTADYDSPKNRRSIWRLFDEIKTRSGFEIDFDRVLVQVWPSRDGGCEMFISKILAPIAKGKIGEGVVRYITYVYAFEGLKNLLRVCRALTHMAYAKPSQVWRDEGGRWYLFLEGESGKTGLHALSFIEEFGVKLNEKHTPMIHEHAHPIATQCAVEKLSAFAE